jgi:hypothetical protein
VCRRNDLSSIDSAAFPLNAETGENYFQRNNLKNSMQERRRDKRFPVDNDELNSSMAFAHHVEVLDISEGGISVKADLRLNIGRQYTLTIKTKRNVSTVKGTIVWSSLIDNKEDAKGNIVPIYKAGLQFSDVSRKAVNEIIGSLGHKKQDVEQDVDAGNDSEYVNLGLEYLDIREKDKEKLENVIESLC